MRIKLSAAFYIFVAAMLAVSAGCGGGSEKKTSDKDFRVPDSLITEIAKFGLTQDDYHTIRGGTMANKDIVLKYPASPIARYVAVETFGNALEAFRLASTEYERPAAGKIYLIGAKDLQDYKFLARKDWWYYGVIDADTIYFEPFDILIKRYDMLSKRNMNEIGLTQKIAQMSLIRLSGGRIPAWLRESLASRLADEKMILQAQAYEFKDELVGFNPTVDELDGYLDKAVDRGPTRVSFFISYLMMENLLKIYDIDHVVAFVRGLGEGKSLDESAKEQFGMDYGALIEKIRLKKDFTNFLADTKGLKRPDKEGK